MDLFTQIMSAVMFAVVSGFVIVSIVRTVSKWSKNEKAPKLTVEAKIMGKRTARRRTMSNKQYIGRDNFNYYATFQLESGDRMELELIAHEYGLLKEGDRGKLTFQGTRYLGFDRTQNK